MPVKVFQTVADQEDHIFSTTMKGKTVWVIEDAVAFTMLSPDDY